MTSPERRVGSCSAAVVEQCKDRTNPGVVFVVFASFCKERSRHFQEVTSSDNRPQDPFSAQPGEFPSVPDFEEEGFRHSVDLLESFEEFMDLTPNAPASSFAFGLAISASAPIATPGMFIHESPGADLSEAFPAEQSERRQLRNRMSQRRFRERQEVG